MFEDINLNHEENDTVLDELLKEHIKTIDNDKTYNLINLLKLFDESRMVNDIYIHKEYLNKKKYNLLKYSVYRYFNYNKTYRIKIDENKFKQKEDTISNGFYNFLIERFNIANYELNYAFTDVCIIEMYKELFFENDDEEFIKVIFNTLLSEDVINYYFCKFSFFNKIIHPENFRQKTKMITYKTIKDLKYFYDIILYIKDNINNYEDKLDDIIINNKLFDYIFNLTDINDLSTIISLFIFNPESFGKKLKDYLAEKFIILFNNNEYLIKEISKNYVSKSYERPLYKLIFIDNINKLNKNIQKEIILLTL